MVFYKNPSEFREKVQKCQEYIGALEEELKKIQVFERELPLCLELVSQAIERCRQQMTVITESCNGQFDEKSSECPVLEEFIPMKSTSSTHEDVDDHLQQKLHSSHESKIICSRDWLASAQLSIQAPDQPLEESKKLLSTEEYRYQGGHHGGDKGQSNKKERSYWSQELHRRFLNALQQLGGAPAATPKQIRQFIKVDGLTNDEIKSHLQKYRLHTRRLNPTIHDTQTPQLVVVGRIWMPPLDYTTNAATSPLTNDIKNAKAVYAPIPSYNTTSYKTKQCKQ